MRRVRPASGRPSSRVDVQNAFHLEYIERCREAGLPKPDPQITRELEQAIVNVRGEKIVDAHWDIFLDTLSQDSSLKTLKIELPPKHEAVTSYARPKSSEPTGMYKRAMTAKLARALASSLRLTSTLHLIELNCVNFGTTSLEVLGEGLKANKSLTALSLSGCRIGDMGFGALFGALKTLTHLTRLDLSDCALEDMSGHRMATLIQSLADLQRMSSWSDTLRKHPGEQDEEEDEPPLGLSFLNISNNRLTDRSATSIAHALRDDLWMRELRISGNKLTHENGRVWLDVIPDSTLIALDLTDTGITSEQLMDTDKLLNGNRRKAGLPDVLPRSPIILSPLRTVHTDGRSGSPPQTRPPPQTTAGHKPAARGSRKPSTKPNESNRPRGSAVPPTPVSSVNTPGHGVDAARAIKEKWAARRSTRAEPSGARAGTGRGSPRGAAKPVAGRKDSPRVNGRTISPRQSPRPQRPVSAPVNGGSHAGTDTRQETGGARANGVGAAREGDPASHVNASAIARGSPTRTALPVSPARPAQGAAPATSTPADRAGSPSRRAAPISPSGQGGFTRTEEELITLLEDTFRGFHHFLDELEAAAHALPQEAHAQTS